MLFFSTYALFPKLFLIKISLLPYIYAIIFHFIYQPQHNISYLKYVIKGPLLHNYDVVIDMENI